MNVFEIIVTVYKIYKISHKKYETLLYIFWQNYNDFISFPEISYIPLEIRVNMKIKFYNVAFIQRIWPTFHSLEFANTLLNNGNMPCMLTLKNIKSSKQILPLFISRRKMNLHLRCIENFCLKRNSDPFIRKFLENFCPIFNKKFVWKLLK